MAQSRTKIRKALVALIKDRTNAKSNVVDQRTLTNWIKDLPAINIYLKNEDITEFTQAPRSLKRIVSCEFQIVVSATEESIAADKLEEIIEQVEDLIDMDDTIGDNVQTMMLNNIEIEEDPGGDEPVIAARVVYNATYLSDSPRTRKGQGADGNLATIDAKYPFVGTDADTPKTEDTITVP